MIVVDVHAHAFPDAVAENAIRILEENSYVKAFLSGTVADLRASMRQAGVDRAVVQPVSTKPAQVRSINDWAHRTSDEQVTFFGTIHPDMPDVRSEVIRLKGLGFKGIKFHPDYQDFYIDEDRMYPIYEALADHGLVVMFHMGVDIGLPEPVHAPPRRLARVLDRVPELTVIASHLGGYRMWREVADHLVGREVYLDTSLVPDRMDADRAIDLMRAHGIDRILFGTDSPWDPQDRGVRWVSGLDIDDAAKRKILGENAVRLLEKDS